MFEHAHDYEAFWVDNSEDRTDEVRVGAQWIKAFPGSDDGVLVTTVADQLRYTAAASAFPGIRAGGQVKLGSRIVRAATKRTFPPTGWGGGPVLVLWPSLKFLGEIHDFPSVKALCVVPGSSDITGWIAATQAVEVRSGTASAGPPPLDPVIEQAMISLTRGLNHNNVLLGSSDKNEAIGALNALHLAGFRLDPAHLEAWALANSWPSEEAARFREFADGVRNGKRYRVGHNYYRSDIVSRWKELAEGKDPDD